jgi:DNA mismatch repair protein MutS
VVRQAKRILEALEQQSLQRGGQDDLFARPGDMQSETEIDALRDALQPVNPDELTPRQALELLYRLKKLS